MKFAMNIDYSKYLVMDQATFTKLTEVLSKCEVRNRNGYAENALYVKDDYIPTLSMLRDDQLVDVLPTNESE